MFQMVKGFLAVWIVLATIVIVHGKMRPSAPLPPNPTQTFEKRFPDRDHPICSRDWRGGIAICQWRTNGPQGYVYHTATIRRDRK